MGRWCVPLVALGLIAISASGAILTAAPRTSQGSAEIGEFKVTLIDIVYEPSTLVIPANMDVTISLPNTGVATHTFNIDELNVHSGPVETGETGSVTINAAPGQYTYYCSQPGHSEAGMTGTLGVAVVPTPGPTSVPETATPADLGDDASLRATVLDLQRRVGALETRVSELQTPSPAR